MSQPIKGTAVRLPLDLHTLISDAAVENNRSRHAEMLHRLEQSFERQPLSVAPLSEEIRDLVRVDLNSLEERIMAVLDHPLRHVYSVTIPDDGMSEADMAALRASTPHSGSYSELSDLWHGVEYRRFDSPGRQGAASATGRLSDTDPQLQDLPAVSGLSTLAASVDRLGVCPECGTVTKLDLYHTGGFTGLPEGELPPILERGEQVMPLPFTGKTWVITGSLETMTRDRAREIIMELGGTVAGVVAKDTHALLWGPGAGSKMVKAGVLGIQKYSESQFIRLIREYGVDMPLLNENEWIKNTGVEPEGVTDKSILDFQLSNGNPVLGHHYLQGSSKGPKIWVIKEGRGIHVTHWRHSAYNRQQTFAEHVTAESPDAVWIENAGRRPDNLDPDHMIETKTRPHGITSKRMVGDIPRVWWESSARQLPLISHWRIVS